LSEVDTALLYSFVSVPATVGTLFLGVFDMYSKSIVLAVLAGVTQYVFAHVMPAQPVSTEKSFANDFAASMQVQMKYVFPVFMALLAYSTSAAIALYLITSNLASTIQEVYNRKTRL
jgi:membrane protein insertase Oxa1/YidC/SpoIIIJ